MILILFDFWCFNATFSIISATSWRPVLVVEEAGVPVERTTDHGATAGADPGFQVRGDAL